MIAVESLKLYHVTPNRENLKFFILRSWYRLNGINGHLIHLWYLISAASKFLTCRTNNASLINSTNNMWFHARRSKHQQARKRAYIRIYGTLVKEANGRTSTDREVGNRNVYNTDDWISIVAGSRKRKDTRDEPAVRICIAVVPRNPKISGITENPGTFDTLHTHWNSYDPPCPPLAS